MAQPTSTIKFPAGIDNRSREYELAEGAARHLLNLDVTKSGGLRSRRGLRRLAGGACHSLWSQPQHPYALLVQDGVLTRLDVAGTLTPLRSVLGLVVYAPLNDQVFWTDGVTTGAVDWSGHLAPWGLSTPPAPLCAASDHGGLQAGVYQVAMTAVLDSGLESGALETVTVAVPEGGGIAVTTPAAATNIRFALYRTNAEGGRFELRQAAIVAQDTTHLLGGQHLGRLLDSLHATPPPPGQHLAAYQGRLWIGRGKILWYTAALAPHWVFPETGFFQLEAPITLLAPAADGLYVGTAQRIYFLPGPTPEQMQQRLVDQNGAVSRCVTSLPTDVFVPEGAAPAPQCAFYDRRGDLVIGKPGGVLIRPVRSRFCAGNAASGAMAYTEHHGLRQTIAFLFSGD